MRSTIALTHGDLETGAMLAVRLLDLGEEHQDALERVFGYVLAGVSMIGLEDPTAPGLVDALNTFAEQIDSNLARSFAALLAGRLAVTTGRQDPTPDFQRALKFAEQAQSPAAEINARRDLAWGNLADRRTAADQLHALLELIVDTGHRAASVRACQYVAVLLASTEHQPVAAQLVGLVGLTPLRPDEAEQFQQAQTQLERALGPELAAHLRQGHALTVTAAVDLAIAALTEVAGQEAPTTGESAR